MLYANVCHFGQGSVCLSYIILILLLWSVMPGEDMIYIMLFWVIYHMIQKHHAQTNKHLLFIRWLCQLATPMPHTRMYPDTGNPCTLAPTMLQPIIYNGQGPVLQGIHELIVQILWKFSLLSFLFWSTIMSQICTCQDSLAVVACAKLRRDFFKAFM